MLVLVDLARRGGVLVADALQLRRIDYHVDAFEFSQLAQLQRGERRLQWPAPADDHHFVDPARTQRLQSVIGDVGECQHFGVSHQNAGDVDGDVAVANNNSPGTRQIGRHLLEVRMRVVPAHEIDGGDAARQVLTGNVQRFVGLRADGVDDCVVLLGEFGGLHVFAHRHIAEEAEPGVSGGLFELFANRLDLRVVGGDAGAHQPPGRRQHLQHVDGHVDLVGRVGGLQERRCGEEAGRPGTDDGDVIRTHA